MRGTLQKTLRWQRSVWSGNATERWSLWARSLAERHNQIAFRHIEVSMTLLQMLTHMRVFRQRWQNHLWKLYPQINLSIAPILRETIWRDFGAFQRNQINSESFRGNYLKDVSTFCNRDIAGRSERFHGSLEIAGLPPHRPSRLLDSDNRGDAFSKSQFYRAPAVSAWPTPLRKVFERLSETPGVGRLYHQSLPAQQSVHILRRVVHQRQRMEEKSQDITVLRHLLQQQEDRHAADLKPTAFATQSGIGANPQVASPPAINMEQLTEQVVRQIDRRILAWRERTGRIS
jgi:hypothetical protein